MGTGTPLPQKGAAARISSLSPAPAKLPFSSAAQVATQFKMSLLQLVEILKSKEPAYVRCIKPNDAKQPGRRLLPHGLWGPGLPYRGARPSIRESSLTTLLSVLQAALMKC